MRPVSPLIRSVLTLDGINTLAEFHSWFAERRRAHSFRVVRIPISKCPNWHFEPEWGDLVHDTGRFFRIQGLEVETNFGSIRRWTQPIINQPEIGILGFLMQEHDGVLHVLVQAKMEPGNVGLVQVSPTVQATRSNYTRAHGGAFVPFLQYFLDASRHRVVADQLQSEQGARFLRKRNRNVIIEVDPSETIDVPDDFFWLTVGQLGHLLAIDNLVNMDARSVLSLLPVHELLQSVRPSGSDFSHALHASAVAAREPQSMTDLLSWLTQQRCRYELATKRLPLRNLPQWIRSAEEIRHETGRFFSIIAVEVTAASREVANWNQPIITSVPGGEICFVSKVRDGVLELLVQARVEPGNVDIVELAPTVQWTPSNYAKHGLPAPPFAHLVNDVPEDLLRWDVTQSEEGGRFFQVQTRNTIIELPAAHTLELPSNYTWMTLSELIQLVRFRDVLNVEARSLLASLGVLAFVGIDHNV